MDESLRKILVEELRCIMKSWASDKPMLVAMRLTDDDFENAAELSIDLMDKHKKPE